MGMINFNAKNKIYILFNMNDCSRFVCENTCPGRENGEKEMQSSCQEIWSKINLNNPSFYNSEEFESGIDLIQNACGHFTLNDGQHTLCSLIQNNIYTFKVRGIFSGDVNCPLCDGYITNDKHHLVIDTTDDNLHIFNYSKDFLNQR